MDWKAVRGQRAVMLTSFRRDGRGVQTPMGYGIEADTLYFMTNATTAKVKRLARDPHVEIAASTLRGQLRGPWQSGTATEVTGPDADHARFLITRHNRLAWFFLLRRARKQGDTWRYYAVKESA